MCTWQERNGREPAACACICYSSAGALNDAQVYREHQLMRIVLVTPARPIARTGNRYTAVRWAHMLRGAGHRVTVTTSWAGEAGDLMLALHARRSHDSIRRFHDAHPALPLVVVLTGTDLYRDIRTDRNAQDSLRFATLLVTLQDQGPLELSADLREKTRVVVQSAEATTAHPSIRHFDVCVVGHLREEKDPLRCAYALAHIPATSKIRVQQVGGAFTSGFVKQVERLSRAFPRYRWLGDLPHWRVKQVMQRSRLMVISSRMEGGANVVSEALAAELPILASHIPGNVGLLGEDYAGYFPVGDEKALAQLLIRAESDPRFYRTLQRQCAKRRKFVSPERECKVLLKVVAEAARRARQAASRP
jgi:putative glycosyltransferase (TIGR04348 family)